MPVRVWVSESITVLSYCAFLYAASLLGHGIGLGP